MDSLNILCISCRFSLRFVYLISDNFAAGRYEEEFIEHRMNQLQSFVDRVCRHPVLSQSEVFQHFLTCTDDKRWVCLQNWSLVQDYCTCCLGVKV